MYPSPNLLDIASQLGEPPDYFHGLEDSGRIQTQNSLIFLQRTKRDLQQHKLSDKSHHRHVLLVVLETGGEVYIDGNTLRVEPGNAILIRPYQFHHYPELDARDLKWLFITFEVQQGELRLRPLAQRVIPLNSEMDDTLTRLLKLWESTGGKKLASRFLAILDLFLDLMLAEADFVFSGSDVITKAPIRREAITLEIQSILKQSVEEKWSVLEMARRLKVSERFLRDHVREQMGINIREYKNNYRLHRAISLMRESKLPIGQIADLTGFQSQQAFTRFFKQATGKSPKTYRKMGRS